MELQLGASPLGAVGDWVKVAMTPMDLMAEEMHLLDQAPVRNVMKLNKSFHIKALAIIEVWTLLETKTLFIHKLAVFVLLPFNDKVKLY